MQGFYMYCVGAKDNNWSRMKHFTLPVMGRTLDFESVPYRNVEAIVSKVALQDFEGPRAQKLLKDEQWLKEKVLVHEQVVEEIMRRTPPIVPFKFGTIFRSREKLTQMLKDHYSRFHLLIKRFQDRQEWGVKMFSNVNLLDRALRHAEPELMRFTQKIKGQSAGKKYFFEKEFEARLKDTIEERQRAASQELMTQLATVSEESVCNQVLPRAYTGREDDMILNSALLLKEGDIGNFKRVIARWEHSHNKEGFSIEFTGPWPPYNFTHL